MKILLFLFIILITFPAHAETTFMTWPVSCDAKFRPAYLAKTGEKIADSTAINEAETHYIAGSSRVSQKWVNELLADRGICGADAIKTRKDIEPVDWVRKTEPLE